MTHYKTAVYQLTQRESFLGRKVISMLLHDCSNRECATLITDELERYLINKSDDNNLTHREYINLIMLCQNIEKKFYDVLGVELEERF